MKIGYGYDAHRMADGRPLILGGIDIEYPKGLMGHSDADVLIHAIIDALLGAAGLGDIGKHFPDNDNTYKDISSLNLLGDVASLLHREGYVPGNIDATILAERPILAAYIPEMRKNISDVLNLDIKSVNIKATTEEGMGFTGTEQGISAHAVCLIDCV